MKKISLIVTSLVFCIAAVFIFPAKEANANPLAVGGALYLGGAGIYVVGTLGVAAVAGLVELDSCPSCQADIEAHAHRTWDTVTQQASTGMQAMVDSAVGVGNGMTSLDQGFNDWFSLKKEIFALGLANEYIGPIINAESSISYVNQQWEKSAKIAFNVGSTYKFEEVNATSLSSLVSMAWNSNNTITIVTPLQSATVANPFSPTEVAEMILSINSLGAFNALLTQLKPTAGFLTVTNHDTIYASVSAGVNEAWEDMQDAGLVLPVDNARPMAGDIPLTYDPVTDSYAGIDGVTVAREDITGYEYQKPHWKTLDDLAALGLSGLGAGLYIDGWVGSDSVTSTYDPATDITTTVTSTGTTTNVTTGETSVTGSTTTTSTGDTTGNPPVDVPPTTAPKTGEPLNPFKAKPMPIAALTGLFQLLAALIFYLIRLFTFIATLALIAPTPIDNPYFIWFTTATFQGITPYPLVQNLALFFLGFSVYRSVRRVFG